MFYFEFCYSSTLFIVDVTVVCLFVFSFLLLEINQWTEAAISMIVTFDDKFTTNFRYFKLSFRIALRVEVSYNFASF